MMPEAERESLVGRQLGGYEFLSLIDEGGMGQVYRARDLTLPRDVAVKVVSPEFTHDEVRRARFRKEAEVLAGFAHPHIAHIYAFVEAEGRFLLAMELVPGEALAERIARGPLRVSEALDIAGQVADALDAAHEQGVIHRDLKPANIRITPDGVVKVLDFGLATSVRPALADAGTTISITAPGTVLGTVAYMSPEQARGETADKRTDIWAFGCVLYEMLTGQRLFQGQGTTDTLARLFTQDPDWSALPPQVPHAIRALLKRCLERDRVKRLGDVAAIRFALEDVAGSSDQPAATTSGEAPGRSGVTRWRTAAVSAAVTAAVLIAAAAIGLTVWESEPSPQPPQNLSIPLLPDQRLAGLITGKPILAFSPHERYVAYVATTGAEDARQIYLYSIRSRTTEPVPGSVGAHTPFFSPDEAWLGFYSRQGTLFKIQIPVKGSVAELLTDSLNPSGASWGEHGIVVTSLGSALQELPDTGVPSRALTRLKPGETMHLWPHLMPGGTTLFVAAGTSTIAVQRPGSDERRDLVQRLGITTPQFSPSGHVVYAQAGNLRVVPFDPRRETKDGAVSTLVMSGILHLGGIAHYSLSAKGSVAYVPGEFKNRISNLVRVTRNNGKIEEKTLGASPRVYAQPRVAPDGQRAAVDAFDGPPPTGLQVWLYDLAADEPIPFTYKTEGDNRHATWLGSDRLVFQSGRITGKPGAGPATTVTRQLFSQSADRSALEQLTQLPPGEDGAEIYSYPISSCRDGLLTFVRLVPKAAEAWVMHLGDSSGRGRSERRLDFPMSADGAPSLSTDCRWLAYVSDESGRREVWVRDYPSLGNRHQLSTGGGTEPVWNPDPTTRELLYRNGEDMMAVKVSTQGSAEGKAAKVFTGPYAATSDAYARPNYDVFPDGSFLMLKPVEQEQPRTQINVVLNWSEELKRIGATKK